jgi:hypothetical protein
MREGEDRQACLGAELEPIPALTACSRFTSARDRKSLSYSDAYYNRGVAFTELGEFQHARLDFVKALEINSKNQWARQRLNEVEEKLSKGT